MRLLVQPGDGIAPLVKGINEAKTSVEILIFRFDRAEIEAALVAALKRGVSVRALIAHTNRGGESRLRALESRLLGAGITVARTAGDLVRYHGKMMIVDGRELYLLAFNFTRLDIERSRSFAIITEDKAIVQEATKLFDCDSKRLPYAPELDSFVVSPVNSRKMLSEFIKGAKVQLLIYDPAATDPSILRLLQERSKAGVDVRILGRLSRKIASTIEAHTVSMRLHARMMIRDSEDVFLGSQSLRTAELDARREIGLIFHEPKITARVIETFEADWTASQNGKAKSEDADAVDDQPSIDTVAKRVAKTVTKSLPPMGPVLQVIVRELAETKTEVEVDTKELEASVRDAVKSAVKEAVAVAVEEATSESQ